MKKTQKISYFALGLVVALVVSSVSPALAASVTKQVSIAFRDIKLVVDGVPITPKDAAGKVVEPFVYEGTTYLPVRALADALGKTVEWDGNTSTVYVGKRPGAAQYLPDVCPAYQKNNTTEYSTKNSAGKDYFQMAGVKYYDGIVGGYGYGDGYALYNLNGQYKTLSGLIGHVDDTNGQARTVYFYADGVLVKELELTSDVLPQDFSLSVSGVLQLKIEFGYRDSLSTKTPQYGIGNPILE